LPSDRVAERFSDILGNIEAISRYTHGMSQLEFQADSKTADATERCLTRISEAAIKLGTIAEQLAPDQPWHAIRGIRNRLRHEYDKIDRSEIWRIVADDLPLLRVACKRCIEHARLESLKRSGDDS
jgi:uncharacterized protein with HEPN domain